MKIEAIAKERRWSWRKNLQAAENKVKEMDPEYDGICGVSAKEYPHWNDGK